MAGSQLGWPHLSQTSEVLVAAVAWAAQFPLVWPLCEASLDSLTIWWSREDNKPQCTCVYEAFACVLMTEDALVKLSHMATLRENMGGTTDRHESP